MLIAIDTATDHASLALHDGFQVLVEHTWESPRRHTIELAPRLAAALERLELHPKHFRGVAVTSGPGSFTGLRIGMAVAKGLTMAHNLPLIGVPTLDVVAAAQGRDRRPLCAVLQAGRGRVCAATYHWQDGEWLVQDAPYLTTWSALAEAITTSTLFCGEIDQAGTKALKAAGDLVVLLPAAARLRRAGFLAELAWRRLNQGETDDPTTLTPTYLQHPT
jgi:tRNA threonylcarbamoyladenosine biosynthesis protein TsaB